MQQPTLIIFTGLPGTGKTSISRKVADELSLPLIAKDDIKEIMYDKIGWSDKAFSAKLAHATFGIMDYVTDQHLKNGLPLILESNYSPKLANETFQALQSVYNCAIIQIVCRTDTTVLAHRFFERQHTDRHPGHNDSGSPQDHEINFRRRIENGENQPLDVEGPVLIVDTTDFNAVRTKEIAKWVKHAAQH